MTFLGRGQTVYRPYPPTVSPVVAHSLIVERVVHAMRTPLGVLSAALTEIHHGGPHEIVMKDAGDAIERLVLAVRTLSASVRETGEEEVFALLGVRIREHQARVERGLDLAIGYLSALGETSVRAFWDAGQESIVVSSLVTPLPSEPAIALLEHIRHDHSLESALLLAAEQHVGAIYVQPATLTIPLSRDGA